ncbi:hypothetical protein KEM55_003202 [Ascosphaera atra]|nr:hypothetical protein KEM55_003202 [Ascosphaera atra]
MRVQAIAGFLLAATAGGLQAAQAADAPITKDSVGTAVYAAELLNKDNSTIRGIISGQAGPHGRGVRIHLRFTGLPDDDSMAPYLYHIHQYRVPEDGDCYATGGHLSPYGVPDTFVCDPAYPMRCQPGDLSGKHGKLPKGEYLTMYKDDYLSINTLDPTFFGNLSIVVHANDQTRLNCGNFQKIAGAAIAVPVTNPNLTTDAPPGFPSTATVSPLSSTGQTFPVATGNGKHAAKHTGTAGSATVVATGGARTSKSSSPKSYHSPKLSAPESTDVSEVEYTSDASRRVAINGIKSAILGLFWMVGVFFGFLVRTNAHHSLNHGEQTRSGASARERERLL